MLWCTLAFALPESPSLFEPSAAPGDRMIEFEIAGQTYVNNGFAISGATASFQHSEGPWVFGAGLRVLDDPFSSERWNLHVATLWGGYSVVNTDRVRAMIFGRAGTHVQAGASVVAELPVGSATLVFDGLIAPSMRLPFHWLPPRLVGIWAEPEWLEAGIGIHPDWRWRPALRVGVLTDKAVATIQIGHKKGFALRATLGVSYLHRNRGFGMLSASGAF